ncbi:MAG: hypothetical protein FWC40_08920, partial [Proteobacteria bacterium]|nr:hypothetical protein [Pseudomonadota bacterium]
PAPLLGPGPIRGYPLSGVGPRPPAAVTVVRVPPGHGEVVVSVKGRLDASGRTQAGGGAAGVGRRIIAQGVDTMHTFAL